MRGHVPVCEQGRAPCPATGRVALARTQAQSSCSHPPLGTLPASYPLLLLWPSQRPPVLFWEGPDSAEEAKLAFLLTGPHTTISHKISPRLRLGTTTRFVTSSSESSLSETSWTSHSHEEGSRDPCNIFPHRVTGYGSKTPSQENTLCGLCHLRHDVVASITLQLEATIPAHLPGSWHPAVSQVSWLQRYLMSLIPISSMDRTSGIPKMDLFTILVREWWKRRGKGNKTKKHQEEIKMLSVGLGFLQGFGGGFWLVFFWRKLIFSFPMQTKMNTFS